MQNSSIWRNRSGDLRAVWSVLILIGTIGIVANPLVLALDATNVPVLENSLKNLCVAIAVMVAIVVICRLSIYGAADFGFGRLQRWWVGVLLGLAAGAVPIYVFVAAGWGFGALSITDQSGTDFTDVPLTVALIGQAIRYISGSFFEETVARGFLFYLLLTRLPWEKAWQRNLTAILVSSVIFSLLHLGNPDLTPLALINLAAVGVWFGVLYLGSGNLLVPIMAHFAWNLFQNNVFGMPNGGGESKAWILNVRPEIDNIVTGSGLGPEGSLITTLILAVMIGVCLPWVIKRELISREIKNDAGEQSSE